MISTNKEVRTIKEDLAALLSGIYTLHQLKNVIRICHAFAVSSVNSKIAAGRLNKEFIGLNSTDIAWDCIADLFPPDANGIFVQLKSYFSGMSFENISDEELFTHFRRLIFSKVNDGLFRMYREMDPVLAKIIHNIKVVVNTLDNFDEIERLGEKCICPSFVDKLIELPSMDRQTLENGVLEMITLGKTCTRTIMHIPELMSKLSLFLREEKEYCRIVSIVDVAYVFRSIYSEVISKKIVEPAVESFLLAEDVQKIIKETCCEVKTKMKPRYYAKKNGEYSDCYFVVIENTLNDRFFDKEDNHESLLAQLTKLIPGLTKEEYLKSHKSILEYLLKLSTEQLKKKLKNMYT